MKFTRKLWSDSDVEAFIELVAAGTPRDVIAKRMNRTTVQVTNLYFSLRTAGRIDPRYRLAYSAEGSAGNASPLRGREREILVLSRANLSAKQIADRVRLPQTLVASFMSRHGLFAPERRQGARPRQTFRLAVNLKRMRLADVDEADVRLARQAWAEFEKSAA
jgi:hypothetical protein